jgi:hypothetical protein
VTLDAAHEAHADLVFAWCHEAIAGAWDSGRLARVQHNDPPFAREVAGLLDAAAGLAPDELTRTRARSAEIEAAYRAIFRPVADLAAAARSPLGRLAHGHELSELAADILLVVAAPQLRGEVGRAYAILANDARRPLVDELLVCQLLGDGRCTRRQVAAELDDDAPLRRHGLVEAASGTRPFAALSCPPIVMRLLERGDVHDDDPGRLTSVRSAPQPLAELQLAPLSRERLERALARADHRLRLVLRGRNGSGRRTVLAALAGALGCRLAVIDVGRWLQDPHANADGLRRLLRDAAMRGWLPCLAGLERLDGEDRTRAEAFRGACHAHEGPLTFALGRGATPPLDPGYDLVDLDPLDAGLRAQAWESALARHGLPADDAPRLSGRYFFGPGVVDQVCRRIDAGAGLAFATAVDEAIRSVRRGQIGDVATQVTRLASWDSLVLPPDTLEGVHELVARVRWRHEVYSVWGYEQVLNTGRGLTAMFQGGPGTGKSMVAGVIARELGLDLYRVDTSRILSKWIGETEKNLSALFDAAEDGDVILLFDEADSLFARRTEVHTSTDRYANAAVNLLLQRLDDFEGIALLTTNFGKAIDSAVMRRLSMRITFPFPDVEARVRLWQAHVPSKVPIDGKIDWQALAQRYELSGGYIRNAAIRAAFLAVRERRGLAQQHLERAVQLEYREVGKLSAGGRLE